MADLQPITIVGGGLAGLTLGIALRQRQTPVVLWEAGGYPRHRVCGEFISGRGLETLERLGLRDRLLAAGARWAHTFAFFTNGSRLVQRPLPEPALCLSRHVLDGFLAGEFRSRGGDLHERQRWSGAQTAAGVVSASGRRVEPAPGGWHWLGLKAHARGVEPEADLEMHFQRDGYVGLCRLPGEINVCGLFRYRAPMPDLKHRWQQLLAGEPGSALRARLADATWDDDSFCAVAGLCLRPWPGNRDGRCAIGDALTMTPPLTGNGMSLAFESAELAVDPLVRYSRGEIDWSDARQQVDRLCRARFGGRLRTAAVFHQAVFQPVSRRLLLALFPRTPRLLPLLFQRTR